MMSAPCSRRAARYLWFVLAGTNPQKLALRSGISPLFRGPPQAFPIRSYIDVEVFACICESWPRQRVDRPLFRSACNPISPFFAWPSASAAQQQKSALPPRPPSRSAPRLCPRFPPRFQGHFPDPIFRFPLFRRPASGTDLMNDCSARVFWGARGPYCAPILKGTSFFLLWSHVRAAAHHFSAQRS